MIKTTRTAAHAAM